jgi:hypothetical protein
VVFQVFDYVDDDWKSLQKLCGRDVPPPINSTGSQMRVQFHSNAAGSNNGFQVIILFYYNFHSSFCIGTMLKWRLLPAFQGNMLPPYSVLMFSIETVA